MPVYDAIVSKNLLNIDGVIFNAIRFTSSNATVKVMSDVGRQATTLGASTQTDGFLIYSNASGETSVTLSLIHI